MSILVRNRTANAVQMDSLGITIPAQGLYDVTYFSSLPANPLLTSTEFLSNVANANISVISQTSPETYYSNTVILQQILQLGINAPQLVTIFNASAPTVANDSANGYAVGMKWQSGNDVYSCTNATANAATWIYQGQDTWTHPGFVNPTGVSPYYGSIASFGTTTTAAPATGTIYFVPIFVGPEMIATRIGFEVTSAQSTGSTARMALYSNSYPNGGPGNLVVDYGTIATNSTAVKEYTINLNPPTAQVYWMAIQFSSSSGVIRYTTQTQGDYFLGRLTTSGNGIQCFTNSSTYAAFANNYVVTSSTSNPPFMWMRYV